MVSEKAEGILLQAKGFVGVLGGEPEQHDGMKALQGPDFSTSKQGSCTFGVYSRNSANDSVDQENTILFTGSPFFQEGRPWDGSVAEYKALDGKFAIAKIAPQSVELATDVLGAGAVFYIYVKSHFFFASHLGLLLKVLPFAPALNPLGVAAQLYARAQLFDETHFSGIFRLAAGSVLTAEHELHSQSVQVKTTQRRGARSLLDIKAPTFGPDTLMTVLGRGVARYRFDEKSVLMLSGGRDSLAIALANERAPKHAVTYGDHYSTDFTGGKRRARQLGLNFLPVPYKDWHIGSYASEIVGLHAGCSGLQTAHNIVGFDWAKSRQMAAVGFLGGVLTGAHIGSDKNPTEKQVLKVLLPNLNNPLLGEIFAEEKSAIKQFVLEKFRELSLEIGARRALMVLELEWRQAHWISMMFDLCDWFLPVAYPFFQRELIASSLQASSNMLKKQSAYDKALSHALGKRSLSMSMDSFFSPGREAQIAAFLCGKKRTGRVDWTSVIKRSGALPEHFFCGDKKLDELTERSWASARRYGSELFPIACTSAPIAAAVNQLGEGGKD